MAEYSVYYGSGSRIYTWLIVLLALVILGFASVASLRRRRSAREASGVNKGDVGQVAEADDREHDRGEDNPWRWRGEEVEHAPNLIMRMTVLDASRVRVSLSTARWLCIAAACGATGAISAGGARTLLETAFRRRRGCLCFPVGISPQEIVALAH